MAAIANGAEIGREPAGEGLVRVRFADTMAMATYLAAFVVGPLEVTDPVDVDGVPLRIVHVPGKKHLTDFALEVGAFSLRFFGEYYGIPYPERKMDLVAIPDFAHGAMENVGCVTFRESLLLIDPATATHGELTNVADVVAHELAHMWFGDLVTMRWWNGTWLNEAFATLMAVFAVDAYRPDWKRWEDFILHRTSALQIDALSSTRSIEYPVHSPDEARGMFDVLTYTKGAAVLRMLEQYLGQDRFRAGIRRYLNDHEYANTETTDLWDALEAESGEPVRRIMDSWIWQGGYPVVTVRAHGDQLRLSQQRFVYEGEPGDEAWVVPLSVRQQANGRPSVRRVLVEAGGAGLPLVAPDALVVANAEASAFLRSRYEGDLLARLGSSLGDLSALERYALVDDTWASVVAGMLSAADYLAFAMGFSGEDDLNVWQILLEGLGWFDRFVDGPTRDRLRAEVRGLVGPALSRLGWDPAPGESDLTRELRGTLVRVLAVLGDDAAAQTRARELLDRSIEDPGSADAALTAAAIRVVASTGGTEDYERFIERSDSAATPQEQLRYLFALSSFRQPETMRRTLELCLTDRVRTQNAPFVLGSCVANRDLGSEAWGFIATNWDLTNQRFPATTIISLVGGIRTLTKPEDQRDVEAFFRDHDIPQSRKTLEQMLELQRVGVALRGRATPDLERALS